MGEVVINMVILVDEANIETHGKGAELQGSFDKTKHP
jgi:beta-galactosidase